MMQPVTDRQIAAGLAYFVAFMAGLFGSVWLLSTLLGLLLS